MTYMGGYIWTAVLCQDIVAQVENITLKVYRVDAHMPQSCATEEHWNNEQVDKDVKIK